MTGHGLVLLGGGGHASDVLAIWEALNPVDQVAVTVLDEGNPNLRRFHGRRVEIVSDMSMVSEASRFVAAVGYPETRETLTMRAIDAHLQPAPPLVDPDARVNVGVEIGIASVISGAAWLSPMVQVGAHVYVGYGAKVGHDSSIGDFTSLFPGSFVGGDCTIGRSVVVGANATILQGVTVGDRVVVGAGTVVAQNVEPGAVVVGVPGRTRD